MKTKDSVSETWDDLVFENRHKAYGAYVVRQHYSQNMTAGLGVSVSLAALLVMLPKILAMFGVDDKIISELPLPTIDGGIIISPPPPIDMPPPVAPPPSSGGTPPETSSAIPTVTNDAPMENTVTPNDQIAPPTTEPGTGEGPPAEVTGNGPGGGEIVAPVTAPPQIFDGAQIMPHYKDGLQALARFIQRKVRTPRSVSSQGVSGTVFVQFVVRSDGSITDVIVVKGIAADADREAIRLVSLMRDWSPGIQNDIPVSVRMVLPIKFTSETPANY